MKCAKKPCDIATSVVEYVTDGQYLHTIILYQRYVNDNGGSFPSGIYCIHFVTHFSFMHEYDTKNHMIKS